MERQRQSCANGSGAGCAGSLPGGREWTPTEKKPRWKALRGMAAVQTQTGAPAVGVRKPALVLHRQVRLVSPTVAHITILLECTVH